MPKPFKQTILYKDIERCPYVHTDPEYIKWHEEDDKRILLINLDRYVDELQKPNWHNRTLDLSHIKQAIKQTFKLD